MERNQSDKPTETHHHDHSHSHSHSAHDLLNTESLYIDIHDIGPGKVTFDAVAEAHQKDLETQDKHGVHFIKYWVNEEEGKVYCLSKAPNSQAITETHKEAHGLMPTKIIPVTEGQEAQLIGNKNLYLDIHKLGPGMVTAKAVAEAHEKDLAVQDKYGVNFINYWVDEKEGIVVCLCEASDPSMLIKTHNEAHGLLPDEIRKVQQGE